MNKPEMANEFSYQRFLISVEHANKNKNQCSITKSLADEKTFLV